jgi:hypothetical protein
VYSGEENIAGMLFSDKENHEDHRNYDGHQNKKRISGGEKSLTDLEIEEDKKGKADKKESQFPEGRGNLIQEGVVERWAGHMV